VPHTWANIGGLALALLLSACSPNQSAPANADAPLQIGLDLWAGYYPALLADQLGFFRDEHVAVEISLPEDTDQLLVDFAAGSLDGIGVAAGDTINVLEVNAEARIVLFSDISDGADMVLALPPIDLPEDLAGKSVGTNLGGFGELLIRQMLDQHGVPSARVKLLNVDAAQAVDRLIAGEVAAVHTWEPYATRARAAGARVVYTSRQADGLVLDGFLFSSETLSSRPEAVRCFLRAWFRAIDHWTTHAADDNRLLEKRLAVPAGSVNLTGIRLMTLAEERRLFEHGTNNRSAYHVLEQYVDYFLRRGTLSAAPDLGRVLDARFLPSSK
jgi:NitT/TauT family transport system substrate-binding protein